MFDVGFAELFLLGLIGLLVLGPERLPAVARTVGGFMRKARASWASLRSTIEAELAEADIAAPIKEAGEELKRIGNELKSDMPDMNKMIDGKPSSAIPGEADQPAIGNKTESAEPVSDKAEADNGVEPVNNQAETDNGIEPVNNQAETDNGTEPAGDQAETDNVDKPGSESAEEDKTVQPGHGST